MSLSADSLPARAAPRARSRSSVATVVLAALALPLATASAHAQGGLLGFYFDDIALTQLVDERVDPVLDFTDWSPAAPQGTDVTPDGAYAERWIGSVLVETTGAWTFQLTSNDGVRLWVDDIQLVETWVQQAATVTTATINLVAGWHPIRVEHFQLGGSVTLQLAYSGPGQPLATIPTTHLRPAGAGTNDPPWADAGPDVGLFVGLDADATLAGAGRDDDGTVAAYAWTQIEGPPVVLEDAGEPVARALGLLAAGTYAFALTVTDDDGESATDTTRVFVMDAGGPPGGSVSGTLAPWCRVTVDFDGPALDEQSVPSPFLDHRLDVTFVHQETHRAYRVPGFFAADGNAADSGATGGDVWRARFTPDAAGAWMYHASFRTGPGVAVAPPGAGTPDALDGTLGGFTVGALPSNASGFRARGRVEDIGRPTWCHAQTDAPFLKGGANSPENLLAFADFDQTTPSHAYAPHLPDWLPGDPTWGTPARGHALVGALNYLAGRGMNAVYFVVFNIGGDGDDVWPWTSKAERLRYDVSKLEQWEVVFEHMDDLGILLHVVLQETETELVLDGGALLDARRLYYRELVARFGHHLGLAWNLGEESGVGTSLLLAYDDALAALDAYGHPRVVHTYPGQKTKVYAPLLDARALAGASLQNGVVTETHATTRMWRLLAADRGRPWALHLDEIGPPTVGAAPDAVDPGHDLLRVHALWGHLVAGGAGVEWYFGYAYPNDDLDCEDWRSRDLLWAQTRIALDFFAPFAGAEPADTRVGSTARALATDDAFAIQLPAGGTTTLDLLDVAPGTFDVRWYDPRAGGALLEGSQRSVEAPGIVALGAPPSDPTLDWAVLVTRRPSTPSANAGGVAPAAAPGS